LGLLVSGFLADVFGAIACNRPASALLTVRLGLLDFGSLADVFGVIACKHPANFALLTVRLGLLDFGVFFVVVLISEKVCILLASKLMLVGFVSIIRKRIPSISKDADECKSILFTSQWESCAESASGSESKHASNSSTQEYS